MNPTLIDRVLSCPTLPTLPGVAVRVLELTRDPKVSITTMAQTVQGDPALAIKVLKTVNSSYYGLSAPCPSITRAMSMLGLNTVKAIVLGFSLVDSAKSAGIDERFDMTSYWRRAVYCAAAARAIALHTACCDPEEAFIAGMVQDIGMLACFAAIKDEYLKVLKAAPVDHDEIAFLERKELGFDHAKIGRLLAERWRLPHQLLDCIGSHHSTSSASPENEVIVRVMHLAGLAAGALILRDNKRKLGEFITKGRTWFELEPATAKELLKQTAFGAAELSKVLELKTGEAPNISEILSEAREQMVVAQEAVQEETAQLRRNNDELARKNITDGLTGAFNRAQFDSELAAAFGAGKKSGSPLSVIFIDADRFKTINDSHGHQTGDAVLIELSGRLRKAVGDKGSVFRYGGEEFAVLMPGQGLGAAAKFAEQLREVVGGRMFDLHDHHVDLSLKVTISLGVAAMEPGNAASVTAPEQITHGADRGVYAAKAAGRNCVKTVDLGQDEAVARDPMKAAVEKTGEQPRTVMIVEDDPLAARLMSFLFAKCKDLKPVIVKSGEEALEWVANPSGARPRPDLIVSDLNLPGVSGISLIKLVREKSPGRRVPFLIVTATADSNNKAASLGAGADAFIDKAEFCTNTEHWLAAINGLIEQTRAAA
jgi:two-component system, cell cycle response regulator